MYRRAATLTTTRKTTPATNEAVRFRTVFSSTEPVERVLEVDGEVVRGLEVLSHDSSAVDLTFLSSSRAPLLLDHDPRQQVGVIDSARIEGGQGRADGRFSRATELARATAMDVQDGVRRNVSVGYEIRRVRVEPRPGGLPILRVTSWRPFEISVLSVPADMSAATIEARSAGRSYTTEVEMPPDENAEAVTTVEPGMTPEAQQMAEQAPKREAERQREIRALAARHQRRDLGEQAINTGMPLSQFRGTLLDVLSTGTKLETPPSELGLSTKETNRFSFWRAAQYVLSGGGPHEAKQAAYELELSAAVSQRMKRPAKGILIPLDVLEAPPPPEVQRAMAARSGRAFRTLDSTAASSGANLIPVEHLGASFIEVLYNMMRVRQLGATVLSGLRGDVDIPKRALGGVAQWVGEVDGNQGNLDDGDSTFSQVELRFHEIMATSKMTRRLQIQSDPSIEALTRSDLATAIALGIDLAAINGSGTDPVPLGLLNLPENETNRVTFGTGDGGNLTLARAAEMAVAVKKANADQLGGLAWLMNADGWRNGILTKKDAGSGEFLISDTGPATMLGYPYATSEQVPDDIDTGGATTSALIFGAWNALLIGEFGTLELIADRVTDIASGNLRLSALMGADIAFRYPEAFAVSTDMLPRTEVGET